MTAIYYWVFSILFPEDFHFCLHRLPDMPYYKKIMIRNLNLSIGLEEFSIFRIIIETIGIFQVILFTYPRNENKYNWAVSVMFTNLLTELFKPDYTKQNSSKFTFISKY